MFNRNYLQHSLTAGVGAVLVSFAVIGATLAPVRATPTAANSTPVVAAGQAFIA